MNNSYIMTMMLSGIITMNLIFLLFTFVSVKGLKFRVSGASIISSIVLAWPSIIALLTFFPEVTDNKWIVALFMLVALITYLFWLWIFQPDSLQDLIRKDLKRTELKRIQLIQQYLKEELRAAKKKNKSNQAKKELIDQIQQYEVEKQAIKLSHRKPNILTRLFSKKMKSQIS